MRCGGECCHYLVFVSILDSCMFAISNEHNCTTNIRIILTNVNIWKEYINIIH